MSKNKNKNDIPKFRLACSSHSAMTCASKFKHSSIGS